MEGHRRIRVHGAWRGRVRRTTSEAGGKMEPVQAPSSSSPGPLELSTSLSLLSCRSSGEVSALDAGGEHPANCVNRVCGGPAAPGRRHCLPAGRAVLVRVRHHQAGTSRLASRQATTTITRSSTRPRGADGSVAYFLAPAAAATAGYTAWPSLRPPSPPGDLLVVPGDGAAPAVCSSGTGWCFSILHLCSEYLRFLASLLRSNFALKEQRLETPREIRF
jgi:hypothetical protein